MEGVETKLEFFTYNILKFSIIQSTTIGYFYSKFCSLLIMKSQPPTNLTLGDLIHNKAYSSFVLKINKVGMKLLTKRSTKKYTTILVVINDMQILL